MRSSVNFSRKRAAHHMQRCAECTNEYPDELTACPRCGKESEAVHRCARCGEEYGDLDACPACGRLRVEVRCERHEDTAARGRCVFCGRAVCRECDRGDSRVHRCADHTGVPVIQGWAQVYTTTSEFEAQLLRDNLLAEGVDTRVFSQKDNMLSVDLGELSIVRLLVPVWEFSPAVEIIRQHMDRRGEVAFACPACGEAYEPGAEMCASCGEELAGSR